MDLRSPVLAILCGGAPAPGINGVLSSITIEALNSSCSVIGFFEYEGFRQLAQGRSMAMDIEWGDVTRIYHTGGSMIRTSKAQLTTPAAVDNCLRVLQHHRVRYLVTIGGTQTAYSASLVVAAATAAKYKLSVVHIPKSIYNDMWLSPSVRTFGFSTAREVGAVLVQNYSSDARTMLRWYVLVCAGQKAGHLTLGLGKAGASTLTIIAEDYIGRPNPLTFDELATVLEAAIYKRRAMNKEYGVACISEGLASCFDQAEMVARFGDLDNAHAELGRHLTIELLRRFAVRGIEQTVVSRNIGCELRSAPPNASDISLTRDLGFAATRVLMQGETSCLVTLRDGQITCIPFSAIVDPAHASTQLRLVDTTSLSYLVAQSYSIVLRSPDLADAGFLQKLARAANCTPSEFLLQFSAVAAPMPAFRNQEVAGVSFAYMASAFPQLPLPTSPAQPSTSVQHPLPAGKAALTQQTVQQLSAHPPMPAHIVAAGQPVRKGSDRPDCIASSLGSGSASAPPPQLQTAGALRGSSSAEQASTTPANGSGASSPHPAAAWFTSPTATGTAVQHAMQRLSSSSPTPPLHMLTANPQTPGGENLPAFGGTPRGAVPVITGSPSPGPLAHPAPTPTAALASLHLGLGRANERANELANRTSGPKVPGSLFPHLA